MRSTRFAAAVVLASAIAASLSDAAAPRAPEPGRVPTPGVLPIADHLSQIDGPVATTLAPDGRLWAVWSYRFAGEFDVAIVSRDAAGGVWSQPSFFGRRDGVDQLEPSLAVDGSGSVYLAYSTGNPHAVAVTTLPAGSSVWTQPVVLSSHPGVATPSIRLVRDRLVVAYRTSRGVALTDLPALPPPAMLPRGIQDGPDSVDPLGLYGSGLGIGAPPPGPGGDDDSSPSDGSDGSDGGGGNP